MAQQWTQNTPSNEGECIPINALPDTHLTLKQYLLDRNVPDQVYNRLIASKIDLNTLLHLEADELNTLCGTDLLNLSFLEKIKFKAAIKKLQSEYAHKPMKDEQFAMNKLNQMLKRADGVHTLFLNHFNQTDDHIISLKSDIDKEFGRILNELKCRKQALYKQVDEWKLVKLESLNHEISKIVRFKQSIISIQQQCGKNNIKELTSSFQGIYAQNDKLLQYVHKNTKLMGIRFESKLLLHDIQSHGLIIENMPNPLVNLPVIKLIGPQNITDVNGAYRVSLKWNVSIPQSNVKGFSIKYKEKAEEKCNGNDDDKWRVAKHGLIKSNSNYRDFAVDIYGKLQYNVDYLFCVKYKAQNPLNVTLQSNILHVLVSNIVKIELLYHSHRAHYFSNAYHPKQMLSSEGGQGYGSAFVQDFKDGESDWVIFRLLDGDCLYLPKSFKIKCFGNAQSVKTMRVLIGNADENKWHAFNPNTIHVAKNNNGQMVHLKDVDANAIRANKWRHIKFEFLSNHGCILGCKYFIYEVEIFGIKLKYLGKLEDDFGQPSID